MQDAQAFSIRLAIEADAPLILQFILDLAAYEKMRSEVVADADTLREWIFHKHGAQVLIGEEEGVPVGFALYFYNFSTFLGRSGIYLEDLFVKQESRGLGYGRALLKRLAAIAVKEGCGRLEWWCLDWNQPSINFYRALPAEPMTDWTVYRVAGQDLLHLAEDG